MANRIKGITVEIGGDTTKLSKALEGVNKNIKNTQSQLKDVEKLLKLDPTNTELLSQKQKLLADSIGATKDKLTTLKTAAEQANTALANGDITQEQYDALQREIVETEQELRNLESEAGKANAALAKLGEAGEVLQNVGDKMSEVGTTLTTHVTVPIIAAGTAAVKTASDFDSAMSKVAAVSGAAGEELDALRDKAREMGSKTKFSASLVIPSSVRTVDSYVCRDCYELKTVRYEGEMIGDYMFVSCETLTDFTIGNTVKQLGQHVFNYCKSLEQITYEGSLEDWSVIKKGYNWDGRSGNSAAQSGLSKILCIDGYMEYDAETKTWKEVKE